MAALYLEFEAYCLEMGLEEKDFVTMLKGFESMPSKTDEELWNLSIAAEEKGLNDIFLNEPAENLLAVLEGTPKAKEWLERLGNFLDTYGNRISAAHLDVLFPTWKEDPTPVLDTLKSYFPRRESGWDFFEARQTVNDQREDAIKACKAKINKDDLPHFERFLKAAQKIYAYQEDHGFYIDQGCTAALHDSLMTAGRRLENLGLIEDAADIFYLNFGELVEILGDLALDEKIGVYHYQLLIKPLIEERKEDWRKAPDLDAPLTVGAVPETMTDPIAIKVFGIIDEVLHPKGEKKVVERMEGFPGAPGSIEGPARVIMNFEDFPKLQSGEILVCPYTGTAWTPLFLKIGGVVTDTGGMLTHAAIAAREYGIPAVVGTWTATNSIRNGDIIRLDGDNGVVEIIKRI